MGADRAKDIGEAVGDRQQFIVTAHARGDRDHPPDAGTTGAANHGVELVGKIGKIEMAMAVNQHGFAWLLGRARRRFDVTRKDRDRRR